MVHPRGGATPVAALSSGLGHNRRVRARFRELALGQPAAARLSIAHGVAAAADSYVTVSLAGSLFFSLSPEASRQQVLLYLLVTMAPLAVLAPLVGPAVDRFRGRPQWFAAACYLLRAVFCVLLANSLFQLSFYAFAIGLLISSKASGVVKQALVPLVTDDPDRLVSTNATLARMSTVAGGIGGASAAGVLAWAGASWVLVIGAGLFVIAAVVILGLHTRPPEEPVHHTVEYAEMHLPTVLVGSIGFMAIRGAVGFFVFTMAFTLRRASEPPWVYGAAIGIYGAGAFVGNVVTPLLRRHFREQTLLGLAIAAPASLAIVGVLGVSRPLLLTVGGLIGLSTTLGRHSFDSLLQSRAPAASRGRAGARYETRFSLAYVAGAMIATPMVLPAEASMAVLSVIYLPALVVFVRAFEAARRLEQESGLATLQPAVNRLAAADDLRDGGSARAAIIDASAAVDLAQLANSEIATHPQRVELDRLRRVALDPTETVDEAMAIEAIAIARELISPAAVPSPPSP